MAEIKKIGSHTYERLTDEEARREFGSSFVFVGHGVSEQRTARLSSKAPNQGSSFG